MYMGIQVRFSSSSYHEVFLVFGLWQKKIFCTGSKLSSFPHVRIQSSVGRSQLQKQQTNHKAVPKFLFSSELTFYSHDAPVRGDWRLMGSGNNTARLIHHLDVLFLPLQRMMHGSPRAIPIGQTFISPTIHFSVLVWAEKGQGNNQYHP